MIYIEIFLKIKQYRSLSEEEEKRSIENKKIDYVIQENNSNVKK